MKTRKPLLESYRGLWVIFMTNRWKQLQNLVWASSSQGTKIQGKEGIECYELRWTVKAVMQDLLRITFQIPVQVLQTSCIEELAKQVAAAGDLIEQMVGYVVTSEEMSAQFGYIYKNVVCSVGDEFKVVWQVEGGNCEFYLDMDALNRVAKFDDNDRMAIVFKEAGVMISQVYFDATGRYPEPDDDFFFNWLSQKNSGA